MSTATARRAYTPQENLAHAIWGAVLWHSSPDAEPGTAGAYEALYDAVVTAPDYESARALAGAAISAGTAFAGDISGIDDREAGTA